MTVVKETKSKKKKNESKTEKRNSELA